MIVKIKNLITKIRLSETQIINEHLFKEDEKILKSSFNLKNNKKLNNKKIIIFDKKNYKLIKMLKNALFTLSFSEVNIKFTFHI